MTVTAMALSVSVSGGCWFVGLPQKTQRKFSRKFITVLLAEQTVPWGELIVTVIISKLENMKTKITLLISMFILFLLVPSISATPITNVAPTPYSTHYKDDPYGTNYSPSEIAPPNGTKPPIITITAPINNTVIASNNLTIAFNLTLEGLTSYHPIVLQGVCYKPSWQSENVTLQIDSHNQFVNKTLPLSITLTDIPEGVQLITIYANTLCEYETGRENKQIIYGPGEFLKEDLLYIYSNYYFIGGSSSVEFTIDTAPKNTPSVNTYSGLDYTTNILLYTIGTTIFLILIAGLLIYYKRRAKQFSNETLTGLSQGSCTRSLITKTHPTKDWYQ